MLDPSALPEWIQPHSVKWYDQLSHLNGRYAYPWQSTYELPNGETIFDSKVKKLIVNKEVFDIGCGDGFYTIQNGLYAKKIIGFDITNTFIEKAAENKSDHISFIQGDSKDGFPFKDSSFDFAYNRKGPTSSYPSLKRILREGGTVLGLHPGDDLGKELPNIFPGFFPKLSGTPILDKLNKVLSKSKFLDYSIHTHHSLEFLHTPIDVIKYRCFGQSPQMIQAVIAESFQEVTHLFDRYSSKKGLAVTFSRYIVNIKV
ncbi:class I SAM-dependent methyltransferase [Cytobacillus horneckiae]|uniref:class I SAM-dependent methyltransferase n=1 Tax=Cytobacillus horneckiae TaxID=549687 RepID=UPI0039A21D74